MAFRFRNHLRLYTFPYEQTKLVLDSRGGLVNRVKPSRETLILTTRRLVRLTSRFGKRLSQSVTLFQVRKIEIFSKGRSAYQFFTASTILGLGGLLGGLTWILFDAPLISILFGGIPILVGLNLLVEYGFPDHLGEFKITAVGVTIRFPLKSQEARDGSHILVERLQQAIDAGLGRDQFTADCRRQTYEVVKRKDGTKPQHLRVSMGQFRPNQNKQAKQTLWVRSPTIHKKPQRQLSAPHLRSRRHLEFDSHQSG